MTTVLNYAEKLKITNITCRLTNRLTSIGATMRSWAYASKFSVSDRNQFTYIAIFLTIFEVKTNIKNGYAYAGSMRMHSALLQPWALMCVAHSDPGSGHTHN